MATAVATKPDRKVVKRGDLMAFIYYAKVDEVNGDELKVTDVDHNKVFEVHGDSLIQSALSADQFSSTKRITKTKAAEILISSPNRPLSVCFEKADGTERILRGRLVKPEPLLGRSMVEDLDISSSHRLRQVDHRTIRWLIVDGTKYTVRQS